MRPNGASRDVDSFHSRSAQPGNDLRYAMMLSIPLREPAIVPLIPSGANNSVPMIPFVSHADLRGACRAW